jgi:hypothetical protein
MARLPPSCYHLGMRIHQHLQAILVPALAVVALAACSPQYNWRDYSSTDAPFRVMFPDKPAVHTRSVDLDGLKVDMTMTAVQVNGATFAVGSAEAPDADKAEAALAAMQTALVRNIGATVTSKKVARAASAAGNAATRSAAIDIEAAGTQKGQPMRLVGHFESRNKRFYQVIVMGPAKSVPQDQVDMFMSTFKLQ